jgi:hypothetical protein
MGEGEILQGIVSGQRVVFGIEENNMGSETVTKHDVSANRDVFVLMRRC